MERHLLSSVSCVYCHFCVLEITDLFLSFYVRESLSHTEHDPTLKMLLCFDTHKILG